MPQKRGTHIRLLEEKKMNNNDEYEKLRQCKNKIKLLEESNKMLRENKMKIESYNERLNYEMCELELDRANLKKDLEDVICELIALKDKYNVLKKKTKKIKQKLKVIVKKLSE